MCTYLFNKKLELVLVVEVFIRWILLGFAWAVAFSVFPYKSPLLVTYFQKPLIADLSLLLPQFQEALGSSPTVAGMLATA